MNTSYPIVYAVIVTYYPQVENLLNLIHQLSEQKIEVVIVDNTGTKTFDIPAPAYTIRLSQNEGIASAQNHGIRYALSHHADFICFFDQDSTIQPHYCQYILEDWHTASQMTNKPLGAIGPLLQHPHYHFYYKAIIYSKLGIRRRIDVNNLQQPKEVGSIISSGSILSAEALQQVGFMLDELFIDYVDTEWCLRAQKKGYAIFISHRTLMQHTIGDKVFRLFDFPVAIHNPNRRYFIIRNAFWLLRLPHIPKLLALREIIITQIQQLILISIEKNKKSYLQSWYQGIKNGITGKPKQ